MMSKELIKASDAVFHDTEDVKEGRRALEWRRGFNLSA